MSTGHQFFDLQSPRDMLEKARREFSRLQSDLNTDNIFNFFVTVHHIKDYAEEYGIPRDQLPIGGDFQTCRKLCNLAKHLKDNHKYVDNKFSLESVKLWADGIWADGIWDGKQARYDLEGQPLNILELAERVINDWEAFLTRQGL
jgi:hypothetical protein